MPNSQNLQLPSVLGDSNVAVNQVSELAQPSAESSPAAIIGTANAGPAFVPFDIANNPDLEKVFGDLTGSVINERFGPLAGNRFFANGGSSIVFLRTLGAGDCKSRLESGGNEGRVNNAGFVVGSEIVNTATNLVGSNVYAGATGVPGRAYFLSVLMSESNGSTYLSDPGIQTTPAAVPVLRGILFSPSGVNISLNCNLVENNQPSSIATGENGSAADGGGAIGTVYGLGAATSVFSLVLNGHTNTVEYPNTITASFYPSDTDAQIFPSKIDTSANAAGLLTGDSIYFADVFNTDPTKIQEAGHYLYKHYDISNIQAVVTGTSQIGDALSGFSEPVALILTSSVSRNTGSITNFADGTIGVPNFENFQDRFSAPFTPYVTSQKITGKRFDLFRFHSFSDGESARFLKFTILNIKPGTVTDDEYARFDVKVYNSDDATPSQTPLHTFENCTLNPSSENFIARIVGDRHAFHDFDTTARARKTVIKGANVLTTQLVRVELHPDVLDNKVPKEAVPCGFRGVYHLVTSGSNASNPSATRASSTFNGLAALADDNETQLILINSDGTSVTFETDSDNSITQSSGGLSGDPVKIGTGNITSDETATQSLHTAFSYAIALGILKMSIEPVDFGAQTEITLTQNAAGDAGNTVITIPANVTANGTTGAGTANFSGGASIPLAILTGSFGSLSNSSLEGLLPGNNVLRSVTQPPFPLRDRLSSGTPGVDTLSIPDESSVTWGARYERQESLTLGFVVTNALDNTTQNLLKFYPSFHTSLQNPWVGDNHGTKNVGGCVLDADVFNRNAFTLENIAIITGSTSDPNRPTVLADPVEWPAAKYIRSGKLPSTLIRTSPTIDANNSSPSDKVRFVDPLLDCADTDSRHFLKFTVPMMGGFDGLNIFDFESKNMTDVSVFRERFDTSVVGKNASSTAAYKKAIKIVAEKTETDLNLLAIPGIRHKSITDDAMVAAEENFNCMFVSDVELYVGSGDYMTGTLNVNETLDFGTTITNFRSRVVANSFSAAYIPDVTIDFQVIDGANSLPPKKVPASVAALGVLARNDTIAGPQAAPMGHTRGKVIGSKDIEIEFDNSEITRLIENKINPILDIVTPPNKPDGMTLTSQVTMHPSNTELSKIGVRRMLIFIRRAVRNIARRILFEPRDQSENLLFRKRAGEFLTNAQVSGLISSYSIVIDPNISRTPTTNDILANADKFKPFGGLLNRTNDSVESRMIRGSIFITPIESEKVIEIDINESTE